MTQPNPESDGLVAKGGAGSNDNDQPPAKTITISELALGMEMDEDALLQRLAGILMKRVRGTDGTAEG